MMRAGNVLMKAGKLIWNCCCNVCNCIADCSSCNGGNSYCISFSGFTGANCSCFNGIEFILTRSGCVYTSTAVAGCTCTALTITLYCSGNGEWFINLTTGSCTGGNGMVVQGSRISCNACPLMGYYNMSIILNALSGCGGTIKAYLYDVPA